MAQTQSQLTASRRAAGIRPETYATCVLDRRCQARSQETRVSLVSMQFELRNYLAHGRPCHDGDWYHEWQRTTQGTLSWDI